MSYLPTHNEHIIPFIVKLNLSFWLSIFYVTSIFNSENTYKPTNQLETSI